MQELLSKQNLDFQERAREVAEKHVRPVAAELDRTGEYGWSIREALKSYGLTGVWVPKDYGGDGAGVLDLCLVVEQLSRACGGVGVAYAVNALGSFPIILGGTDEQKQKYLPLIAKGESLIAFGLLLYAGVGVVSMLRGGNFLDYGVLEHDPVHGQHLGILLVELGVGITVAAVMITIFHSFAARGDAQ